MKLLLTSAGVSNKSIRNALIDLLGKPIEESTALFVPTAIYAINGGHNIIRGVINGSIGDPICEWFPDNSLDNQEKISKAISVRSYAIDDQTAIKVRGGKVEVVSEGKWRLFKSGN